MSKTAKQEKVIIMGGGLAGLAAGYELAKAGRFVTVVERDNQVGGLAKTIAINNFRFDTGPHRWYTKNSMVNQWLLDLLGKEVIKVPRLTRIYFDGKFFFYPIKLMNALVGIGLGKAALAIFDYLVAQIKSKIFQPKLITMEDGYINQFGKTLYETFFKRYSEKLWGQDCKTISIDWVGQRTRGLNIFTIIKETFFKTSKVVSLIDGFSYPKGGIGKIAEKLTYGIEKYGGKVITQAKVIKITHKQDRIISIDIDDKKGKKTSGGDQFISSIPLNDLVKMFSPKPDSQFLKLAEKLKYRDEVQVALFIKKTHITNDTWIYIHPKEIPFMRVMEMDNWSDKLSPKGTTTLVFEVACNEGDKIWEKKDKELIDMVAQAYIQEFHLIHKVDIVDGFVYRVVKEYPVYHLGYREDVERIKNYFNKFFNFQLIGRNGTFRYNNMDHSIEMGLYAAGNIIKGKRAYDVESVNIEREYLEEKRIENIEDERLEDDNE